MSALCRYIACHYLIVLLNLDQTFAYQERDNKDLTLLDLTGISQDQVQILLTTLHTWSVILLGEFFNHVIFVTTL